MKKKESARSIRFTAEALTSLKTLKAANPDHSLTDIVSAAIVEKANNAGLAPVIRFGILDPQQVPHLQLEASLAESRLRQLSQLAMRVRPQDKDQADKLATIIGKVEAELVETRKLRLGLAKAARLGSELTPEAETNLKKLLPGLRKRIEDPQYAKAKEYFELELRVLEAFLPQ